MYAKKTFFHNKGFVFLPIFFFGLMFGMVSSASAACTDHPTEYGLTVNGTIDTGDCTTSPSGAGYYSETVIFSGTAGDEVIFNASWQSPSGQIILVDNSNSQTVFQSRTHSYFGNTVSFQQALPSTGSYTLYATTGRQNETGPYSVSINLGDWMSVGGHKAFTPDLYNFSDFATAVNPSTHEL